MNRGPISFEIQADRLARAIDFYSKVLGWEFFRCKGSPPFLLVETEGLKLLTVSAQPSSCRAVVF